MAKFEADFLEEYSDEALLAELKRVDALAGSRPLTMALFRQLGALASADTIRRRFGGWNEALVLAGLESKYSGRTVSLKMRKQVARNLSDDELLKELKRVASLSRDGMARSESFGSQSAVSTRVIVNRFGSWANAVKLAGLELPRLGQRYSREDYFNNLAAVWEQLGRRPLLREMDEHPSTISSGGYEQKFKGWRKAVYAFLNWVGAPDDIQTGPSESETVEASSLVVLPGPLTIADVRDPRRGVPLRMRWLVLERDRFTCQACGRSRAKGDEVTLHADHIKSWIDGGPTTPENLRALCSDCNLGKGRLSSAVALPA